MIDAFESSLEKFKLEQLDEYLFRYNGKNAGIQRIYGGQVIAQAYLAADLTCLLYTSPSPRDDISSRMPSSA